jgi:hypothetical protein
MKKSAGQIDIAERVRKEIPSKLCLYSGSELPNAARTSGAMNECGVESVTIFTGKIFLYST